MKKQGNVEFCVFDMLEFIESNLEMVKQFVKAYHALEDALLLSDKFHSLIAVQNDKHHVFCPTCQKLVREVRLKGLPN